MLGLAFSRKVLKLESGPEECPINERLILTSLLGLLLTDVVILKEAIDAFSRQASYVHTEIIITYLESYEWSLDQNRPISLVFFLVETVLLPPAKNIISYQRHFERTPKDFICKHCPSLERCRQTFGAATFQVPVLR